MIDLLRESPLLLLFAVAALGYGLGQWRFGGLNLGVAAVLFVGLAFGALHPDLKLPEFVYQFGLVLFVYAMGLSSGPGFVASLRRQGLAQNALVLGVLVLCTGCLLIGKHWLHLDAALTAGVFAGALTNTPALAGVLDSMRHGSPAPSPAMVAAPVIGFSLAYPMGVIGMVTAIALARRLWQPLPSVTKGPAPSGPAQPLCNVTARVTRPETTRVPIGDLQRQRGGRVVFGRFKRDGQLRLSQDDTCLELGDLVSIVAAEADLPEVVDWLGERTDEHLEFDRSRLDYRRLFVSNGDIIGRPLRDLALGETLGARVTRIRRGDVDLVAGADSELQLGDRVRVVAPTGRMAAVSRFFGDSYKQMSEVDALSLGLGIALGLLLGALPIPLGGGGVFKLGFAGGPLIAGLVLGAWGRTGPVVWSLPYSANLTLRHIGVLLFLAGIGTRSGHAFAMALQQGGWLQLMILGSLLTFLAAFATLWIGHRLLRIPQGLLFGVLAGLQTQPAVLAFANEQAGDESPNLGYATVYPVAMVSKIVLAQVLFAL